MPDLEDANEILKNNERVFIGINDIVPIFVNVETLCNNTEVKANGINEDNQSK